MRLTEIPEIVQWPETHYVFIEKVGPFVKAAPEAWQSVHAQVPAILAHNQIAGYMSLYKVGPKVYRGGLALADEPRELPAGFAYEKFKGGKYSRFVLTGAFSDLPAACSRVFEIVEEKEVAMRDDFCIEHYVTDPRVTPVDENVIEILIPTT